MKTSLSRVVDFTSTSRQPPPGRRSSTSALTSVRSCSKAASKSTGAGVRLDDPSCLLECFRDVQVVVRDEVSARETLAGDFPHFVAGVEDGLETVVNRRRQLACVGVVPEPPMALHPGDVARLRETMRVHGAVQCSAPACTINGRKHPLNPSRNHLLTPEALPSRPGTRQIQPSAASTASTFSSASAVSTIARVTTASFACET